MAGQSAQLGAASSVSRLIARAQRLEDAISRADGDRKASLEQELAAIDAQFGGGHARLALVAALTQDTSAPAEVV